jgi:hypothetical protein
LLFGDEAFIGGELYISKGLESRLQVSKISIFPQFYRHYVRVARTVSGRFRAVFVPTPIMGVNRLLAPQLHELFNFRRYSWRRR